MVLTFNGVSSDTLGVIVERLADKPVPGRRYTTVTIPGRNGDVLIPDGSYGNISLAYELHISAESTGLVGAAHAVAEWLSGPSGYCRLEDDADPGYYLEAAFMGPANVSNLLAKHGRCTVNFTAKPCYFIANDTNTYNNISTKPYIFAITNNSGHVARPILKIYDTNGFSFRAVSPGNDQTISLTSGVSLSDYIEIDCENRTARVYSGTDYLTLLPTLAYDDYPKIGLGINTITFNNTSGSIGKVVVEWRRWSL